MFRLKKRIILTLYKTAKRIVAGTAHYIAIKEHIDQWNRSKSGALHRDEPPLTGIAFIDAWLAGAAEHESLIIDQPAPAWTENPCRFLSEPFYQGGVNSRMIALVETPFAFRRRLLFTGKTFIQ